VFRDPRYSTTEYQKGARPGIFSVHYKTNPNPERTMRPRSGRFHRAKAEATIVFSKGPRLFFAFIASRQSEST
jgi:hypothetical protein